MDLTATPTRQRWEWESICYLPLRTAVSQIVTPTRQQQCLLPPDSGSRVGQSVTPTPTREVTYVT